jgi:hypothetical protein
MKSLTSFIGWLVLAVILAVPAFLFYNWWMNKKTVQMKENTVSSNPASIPFESETEDFQFDDETGIVSTGTSKVVASEEEIASNLDEQSDLQQPTDSSVAALSASSSSNIQLASANTIEVSSLAKNKTMQPSTTTAAASGNQPEASAGNTQEREGSYFEPKSDRDPTLSPFEYAQIKREIAAAKERERQRRLAALIKKTGSGIQNQLILQGVVGNNVIINGEMYSVGNYVKGVKITKIGSNYFIGYYKGKSFKKAMR